MIDIKLPVKWLREKGVELELDDIWLNPLWFGPAKISKSTLVSFNDGELNYLSITSFAWRECENRNPISVPIEVMTGTMHGYAKWKPDAEALMERYTAEQNAKLTETKKETKLKLTKEDVGKEFETNGEDVVKLAHISGALNLFCFDTIVGSIYITRGDGICVTRDFGDRHDIIKRHEPRYWLKDLPDADLFSKDVSSIHFEGDMNWYVTDVNGHDHWLPYGDLPKLDDNDRKLSKISIDDLRVWQKENK